MTSVGTATTRGYRLVWAFAFALFYVGLIPTCGATIVRFEFSVAGQPFGIADFRLFDTAMPRSVANFLGYLDRYEGTFIHRNPRNVFGRPGGNFVVQGGGFEFVPPASAPRIPLDPPILDEPGGGMQGISNLRGTLSNAKSGPDTVTSQWFVNLDDNSSLDSPLRPDGGFAAFGRVLGNGMDVFDAIDLLPKRDLDPGKKEDMLFNDVPVGNFNNPLGTLVIVESISILDLPAGDYNFDGVVNLADYSIWRDTLGSTTIADADGNGNGVVDAADYTIWAASFGQTSTANGRLATVGVPEPTSIVMVAGLLLFGYAACRRAVA